MSHAELSNEQSSQLQALYDEMRPASLTPLWEVLASLVTPEILAVRSAALAAMVEPRAPVAQAAQRATAARGAHPAPTDSAATAVVQAAVEPALPSSGERAERVVSLPHPSLWQAMTRGLYRRGRHRVAKRAG
jgi:hypothetical protein